jgi:hypothetical protein
VVDYDTLHSILNISTEQKFQIAINACLTVALTSECPLCPVELFAISDRENDRDEKIPDAIMGVA